MNLRWIRGPGLLFWAAYRQIMTEGPEDPFESTGPASRLILDRIASYQLALDRLKQSNPFGGENSALF